MKKIIHLVGTISKLDKSYSYNIAKQIIKNNNFDVDEIIIRDHDFLGKTLSKFESTNGYDENSQYQKTNKLLKKYDTYIISFGMINYSPSGYIKNLIDNWNCLNLAFKKIGNDKYEGLYKNKEAIIIVARGDDVPVKEQFDIMFIKRNLKMMGITKIKIYDENKTTHLNKKGDLTNPLWKIIEKYKGENNE